MVKQALDWAGELGVSKVKATTVQNCRDYISGSGSLIHFYVHDLNAAAGDYLKKNLEVLLNLER